MVRNNFERFSLSGYVTTKKIERVTFKHQRFFYVNTNVAVSTSS